jgi:hypothetical protein
VAPANHEPASRLLKAFLKSLQDAHALLNAGPVFGALAAEVAATVHSCVAAGNDGASGVQLAAMAAACPVPGVATPLQVAGFFQAHIRWLVMKVSMWAVWQAWPA